jgi:hypothetical protein
MTATIEHQPDKLGYAKLRPLGDGIAVGRHVNRSEWAISSAFHTMFNQLRYCDTVATLLVIYRVIRSPHAT